MAEMTPSQGMDKSAPVSSESTPLPASTYNIPPHSKTESTMAPTSEFVRIFLLAWIIRYIFRGASGALFSEKVTKGGPWRAKMLDTLSAPGRWFGAKFFPNMTMKELEAGAYALSLGVGSGALSWRYSRSVRNDMMNIFREAVAYEKGIDPDKVTINDLASSNNALVQRTMKTHRTKMLQRMGTDALFFLGVPLRAADIIDVLLGIKGITLFAESWNRKTTMFEDIVTFVNNKINPRSGLSEKITIGEIFDLYQHYHDSYDLHNKFQNVVSRNAVEYDVWAKSEPVFRHITELMNNSYAYKHPVQLDAEGKPIVQDDFTLPKFLYLLGHDLIQPRKPEQTMAFVEIASRYGMKAVKETQGMLAKGDNLSAALQRYPVPNLKQLLQPAPAEIVPTAATTAVSAREQPKSAPGTRVMLQQMSAERAMPALTGPSVASA